MRYLDWDILLFPAVEEGANVPVREFQTRCLAERNDGPPLLHTFVPSLLPGTPFQVSVHSWSKTAPRLAVAPNATPPRELWQVKVVVDGVCLCAEELPVDAAWPQVLCMFNLRDTLLGMVLTGSSNDNAVHDARARRCFTLSTVRSQRHVSAVLGCFRSAGQDQGGVGLGICTSERWQLPADHEGSELRLSASANR